MWCNHLHYSGVAGPWQCCMPPTFPSTAPKTLLWTPFLWPDNCLLLFTFCIWLVPKQPGHGHLCTSLSHQLLWSSSCMGSQHGGLVCVMVRKTLNLWGLVLVVLRGKELFIVSLVFFLWPNIFLGSFLFLTCFGLVLWFFCWPSGCLSHWKAVTLAQCHRKDMLSMLSCGLDSS